MGDAASLRQRLDLILDGRTPGRLSKRALAALALLVLVAVGLSPKAARLTAAVDHLAGEAGESSGPAVDFVSTDEAATDPVRFLPTPNQFPLDLDNPYTAAALSRDGRRLAVAAGEPVAVWDIPAGRRALTLTGHVGTANAVVLSPDGTRIATAGGDGPRLWDGDGGRLLHTLAGQASWVRAAVFSPDGRTLATGGYDKTVRLWDVESGRQTAAWHRHTGGVHAVAFSPDGRLVASAGADHKARLWDAARANPSRPEGALGGGPGRGVRPRRCPARHGGRGRHLAPVEDDRRPRSRTFNVAPRLRHGTLVLTARACPVRRNVRRTPVGASARNRKAARGAGLRPGVAASSPPLSDSVAAVLVAPTADVVYSVSADHAVAVWSAAGPVEPAQPAFRGHTGTVTAVALVPDAGRVATGVIRRWNAAAAAPLATLSGRTPAG